VEPTLPQKTRDDLEWSRILEALASHCRGPVAESAALALTPSRNSDEVRVRLRQTTEARQLLDAGLSPPLGQPLDVRPPARLAARQGVLEPEDLKAIGMMLEAADRSRLWFADVASQAPTLDAIAARLPDLGSLGRELLDSFDERGEVANSASGELGALRERVSGLHDHLRSTLDTLLLDAEYTDMLQDRYITLREERYVLPILAHHKRHVPGIVHGTSGTGQTVYIEPQSVVDANNRLVMAQADVDREIRRILTGLSRRVGEVADAIEDAVDGLAALDLAFAAGALSKSLAAHEPALSTWAPGAAPTLTLVEARHPILMLDVLADGGDPHHVVVPNDLSVGGGARVLVVTGPNTGGKTVAIKMAGLCTLMAMCGLHVPAARGTTLPLPTGVFTDIGDEQSIERHLSTFSGHVRNLLDILDSMGPGALVLLDELVVGTDPVQGAALAQAVLEDLASRDALVLITTHFETLKALPYADDRFRNAAVTLDEERGVPTYHLVHDVPGASSALRTARRLGMPVDIVDRAVELSGDRQRSLEAVVEALDRERSRLAREREALEQERRRASEAAERAEQDAAKLKERLRSGLQQERNRALDEARRLRAELDRLKGKLKDARTRKDVRTLEKAGKQVERIADTIAARQREQARAEAGPALAKQAIEPGMKVRVVSLKRDGVVVRGPDARDRCEVQVGPMTAQVDAADLRRPGAHDVPLVAPSPKTRTQSPDPSATWDTAGPQAPDNTVDLRGMRAHEAIEAAERFLDAQVERSGRIAFLIHGHGTGALKREIRSWLRECPYARDHRAGERGEGGDGVTAVLLR
jgi:DNA mismatch repair protein MutS2